jgi:hypothetical protein
MGPRHRIGESGDGENPGTGKPGGKPGGETRGRKPGKPGDRRDVPQFSNPENPGKPGKPRKTRKTPENPGDRRDVPQFSGHYPGRAPRPHCTRELGARRSETASSHRPAVRIAVFEAELTPCVPSHESVTSVFTHGNTRIPRIARACRAWRA